MVKNKIKQKKNHHENHYNQLYKWILITWMMLILKMEDYMDDVFEASCIERMEVILLEALDWHLCCPTSYHYIQLLGLKLDSSIEEEANDVLMVKMTELVVGALLDYRLIPFKPSLIALSSIWCSLDLLAPITSQSSLSYFMTLFNQHHKVNFIILLLLLFWISILSSK